MRKLLPLLFIEAVLLLILMSLFSLDTGRSARAETSYPDPADEHACPSQTSAGGVPRRFPPSSGPGRTASAPIKAFACLNLPRFPRAQAH